MGNWLIKVISPMSVFSVASTLIFFQILENILCVVLVRALVSLQKLFTYLFEAFYMIASYTGL